MPKPITGSAPPRRKRSSLRRRFRYWLRKLHRDERGTTTLEWALLIGMVALPAVWILSMCMGMVVDYYRMMTMLNSLPTL